jgi:hypothetical protein
MAWFPYLCWPYLCLSGHPAIILETLLCGTVLSAPISSQDPPFCSGFGRWVVCKSAQMLKRGRTDESPNTCMPLHHLHALFHSRSTPMHTSNNFHCYCHCNRTTCIPACTLLLRRRHIPSNYNSMKLKVKQRNCICAQLQQHTYSTLSLC